MFSHSQEEPGFFLRQSILLFTNNEQLTLISPHCVASITLFSKAESN